MELNQLRSLAVKGSSPVKYFQKIDLSRLEFEERAELAHNVSGSLLNRSQSPNQSPKHAKRGAQ